MLTTAVRDEESIAELGSITQPLATVMRRVFSDAALSADALGLAGLVLPAQPDRTLMSVTATSAMADTFLIKLVIFVLPFQYIYIFEFGLLIIKR
jgi:hypothetical protein